MPNDTVLLGDLVDVKMDFPDADFWLVCSGPADLLGKVTYDHNPKHIGIKVIKTEVIYPGYLFYVMEYLQIQQYWQTKRYTTRITVADVKSIQLQQK